MTSLKYSANKKSAEFDLKQSFKRNIVPTFIMLVLLGYKLIYSVFRDLIMYSDNRPVYYEASHLTPSFFENIPFLCVFIGAIFALFNLFVMSKRSVNFYFSSPVDRATLFKNRVVSALICISATLLFIIGVDYLVNITTIKCYGFLFKMALSLYTECLIYILASYIIMLVGIYACHTVVEGLLFGAGLLFFPSILTGFLNSIFNVFLSGYARQSSDVLGLENYYSDGSFLNIPLSNALSYINPFYLGNRIGARDLWDNIFNLANEYDYSFMYNSFEAAVDESYVPNRAVLPDFGYFVPLIGWAVVIALGVLLARRLFIRRKAEHAGIHGSSPAASAIFSLELGIFAAYVYLSNGVKLVEKSAETYLSILILAAITAAVTYIVLAICRRRGVFKNKKLYAVPVISAVFVAALALVLNMGAFGYTSYVPDADEIKMATITNLGLTNDVHNEGEQMGDTMQIDYGVNMGVSVFTDSEDLEKLTAVHNKLKTKGINKSSEKVNIVYLLNNGKKVYREFYVDDRESCDLILSLTDTNAYKQHLEAIFTGVKDDLEEKADELGVDISQLSNYFEYSDNFGVRYFGKTISSGDASVTHFNSEIVEYNDDILIENTDELRSALLADLKQSTWESRYRPSEKELCIIQFSSRTYSGEDGYDYFDSVDLETFSYRVYPSMVNTVNYLKAVGALQEYDYFRSLPEKAYISTVENFLTDDSEDELLYDYYYPYTVSNFGALLAGCAKSEEDIESYIFDFDKKLFGNTEVTDAKSLEQLEQLSRPYALVDKDDYIVTYELTNSSGTRYYQFMLIYKEDMPDIN